MPDSLFRMSMRLAAVFAVIVTAPALGAQQDGWVQVAQSADGATTVSVDARRFQRTELQVDAWLRFSHRDRQRTAEGQAYGSSLSHVLVDCPGAQSRTLQTVYYDAAGNVVASRQAPGRWAAPARQTVMAAAIQRLCATGVLAAEAVGPMRFGALAAGRGTGWSVDYATQAEADGRALAECGAGCRIVARIAGPQCAAYATAPNAWGWAVAASRAQAEADARANCQRRARRGQRCDVAVWACNGRG